LIHRLVMPTPALPPSPPLFPYTTRFRSVVLSCCSQPHGDNFFGLDLRPCGLNESHGGVVALGAGPDRVVGPGGPGVLGRVDAGEDNPLGEDFAVVAVVGCDVVADGVLEAVNGGSH